MLAEVTAHPPHLTQRYSFPAEPLPGLSGLEFLIANGSIAEVCAGLRDAPRWLWRSPVEVALPLIEKCLAALEERRAKLDAPFHANGVFSSVMAGAVDLLAPVHGTLWEGYTFELYELKQIMLAMLRAFRGENGSLKDALSNLQRKRICQFLLGGPYYEQIANDVRVVLAEWLPRFEPSPEFIAQDQRLIWVTGTRLSLQGLPQGELAVCLEDTAEHARRYAFALRIIDEVCVQYLLPMPTLVHCPGTGSIVSIADWLFEFDTHSPAINLAPYQNWSDLYLSVLRQMRVFMQAWLADASRLSRNDATLLWGPPHYEKMPLEQWPDDCLNFEFAQMCSACFCSNHSEALFSNAMWRKSFLAQDAAGFAEAVSNILNK